MADFAAKRFWKETKVEAAEGGFHVLLDGRSVKTPAKNPLVAPSKAIAEFIAAEWDAQEDKVDPSTMPMTRSVNAALDKVALQPVEVGNLIADFGDTDLLCYRAASPIELAERQAAAWDPVLAWAADSLDARLSVASGVMYVAQPANSIKTLRDLVAAQNSFELTALHDLVSLSGSLIIGLAAQRKAFDMDHLWGISRIDEEWQIEQWGRDEEADATSAVKRASFEHAYRFYHAL